MRRFVGVALVACLLSGAVWARVVPRGTEFQVNTYTTGPQSISSVASDAAGNFVVVWSSLGQDGSYWGVFGQRFDRTGVPAGPEFQVNTYTWLPQGDPSVAMDSAGNFVVVWGSSGQDGSGSGVFGQRFDETGTPLSSEFQVNTHTPYDQGAPSVASDPNGDFVVVWSSYAQDGSGTGLFGRRFDSAGTPSGAEFSVNTYTTGNQSSPAVALDAAGNFVVVWTSVGQDGSGTGIFGQRFDSTGTPAGAEFQVNTHTTSYQENPSVASDADGKIVVVWDSYGQDGSGEGVFGQRFDNAGVPAGAEFRVNTNTGGYQSDPSITSDAAGNFVVVWQSDGRDGSADGVFGQRFDDTGTPLGPEFQVNTYTTNYQLWASVASDAEGNFVVTWNSLGQDGSDWGVFGQRFFGRSPTLTSPLSGDTVDCSNPRVIRPTLAWDDDGYDRFRVFIGWDPGFGTGHQVTSGDTLLSRTSWTPSAKKWRKACASALAVNPADPVLYVKIFGVDRSLSKSDPARKIYSTVVQVNVQP